MSEGLNGRMSAWDRLVGPGATRGETTGAIVSGVAGGIVAAWWAWDTGVAATVVATVIALDVVGGVWANATVTTRRWYHRPGTGVASHLRFAAVHVHPFVVAWLFPGFSWTAALVLYLGVIAATAGLAHVGVRLAQPLAFVCTLALVAVVERLGGAPGIEWFPAALAIKLLAGHAVPPGDR